VTTPVRRVSIAAIFSVFFSIGLFSFGGGLIGWVYRDVVLMRGWLNEDEFLSRMAVSQILPGANIANLSIYVGQKLRGPLGELDRDDGNDISRTLIALLCFH
jgi:chromate transporter